MTIHTVDRPHAEEEVSLMSELSERERRERQLRPLFEYLAAHDVSLQRLARRIGITPPGPPNAIYRLRDGSNQTPERVCGRVGEALGRRPEASGYYPLRATRAPRNTRQQRAG